MNDTTTTTSQEDDNFDTSQFDFINIIWIVRPWGQILMESSIFIPVVLFGIFGNILCIYVLIRNSHVRSPTNLLIGNMAAADLFSLLTHPWVILTYDLFQNYQLGSFGCKSEAAFACSTLIASVITMSAISYDRLTLLVLPQETRLSPYGAKIVMLVAWVCGFLISTPLVFYREYKERQWKNFVEKFCTEKVVVTNIYWHVIITVIVWIPLIIQMICYIAIYVKLNKYQKVVLRKFQHQHQVNYKKKAVKMMFAVISTFLVCRLPFTALIFYRSGYWQSKNMQSEAVQQNTVLGTYHTLWFTSSLFIFINAALNPLIYGLTNEKFRNGFRETKLSKWLFPTGTFQSNGVADKVNNNQKTFETDLVKVNIFSIFKKKQKTEI